MQITAQLSGDKLHECAKYIEYHLCMKGHLVFTVQNDVGMSEKTCICCHIFYTRNSKGANIYPLLT